MSKQPTGGTRSSSSFIAWLQARATGKADDWISNLAKDYSAKYINAKKPEWVKEGIIESYKVVTDTYKSLVLAIASGLVSWMVAQVPKDATILPLRWNLLMIVIAAVLVIFLHIRLEYKISLLNSRMDAICGVTGEILELAPKS